MMLTNFGKFNRKLRIDNNEKMKDMAQKLGVTSSYLSAVEHGKRRVPIVWIDKIAGYYKLTEQQLAELNKAIIIDSLSEREKLILEEVVSVIYFNDSSDYIRGLWSVMRIILGENMIDSDGFDINELYKSLSFIGR